MQKMTSPTIKCSLLLDLFLFAILLLIMFHAEMGTKAAPISYKYNRQNQFTNYRPNFLPPPAPWPMTINHAKDGNAPSDGNNSTETNGDDDDTVWAEHIDGDENVCNFLIDKKLFYQN